MSDSGPEGRPASALPGGATRWGPAVVVAGTILVASVIDPGPRAGPLPEPSLHVLAYAALGVALSRATRGQQTAGRVALVLVGATAYGFGIELLQVPIPYREFDRADLLANALGAALSLPWHLWLPTGRHGHSED